MEKKVKVVIKTDSTTPTSIEELRAEIKKNKPTWLTNAKEKERLKKYIKNSIPTTR